MNVGDHISFTRPKSFNVRLSGIKVAKVIKFLDSRPGAADRTRVLVECVEGFGTAEKYNPRRGYYGSYAASINQPKEITPGVQFTVSPKTCTVIEYRSSTTQPTGSTSSYESFSTGGLPPLTFPKQDNLLAILAYTA